MIVYNLFPLLVGRFPEWEPHIDRAAAMGFDWLFVNPVQRPGASGSIYSIADYFELNPALIEPTDPRSGQDQLRSVLAVARERGMRPMADLVIDHCAADSRLVTDHPDWIAFGSDGAPRHPSCQQDGQTVVWVDLAQLDHQGTRDPEGLYQYCLSVVRHLLDLGFEGFRCDAAYQVPAEFWRRLIADAKSDRPDAVFVAETLGCTPWETSATAAAGFDFVFNSSKWWDFRSHWLLEQRKLIGELVASIGFPESHDTPRLADEMNGNPNALKLWYLFTASFSAGCLMPVGFEFGFRRRLHVVSTRPEDWETTSIDLCDFITAVNRLKADQPVFCEECSVLLLPSSNPAVLIMWRGSATLGQEALLFFNTDFWREQYVEVGDLRAFVQSGQPLADVSPEFQMDFVAVAPFSYQLRPGQGLVLVTPSPHDTSP
ncbi:MAG: alpha-amylase family glycosyl hydrolase [Solirubrobacteraceae bacterium]|jgi:starch synthase (maltosyl-transferring)